MSILTINGRAISTLGLEISDHGGIWTKAPVSRGSTPLIGRVGAQSSSLASTDAQTLALRLELPETVAGRRAALDRVLSWLDGLLVLEWDDAPGRVQYGRLEATDIQARFPEVGWTSVGALSIPMVIRLDNPAWYDWVATTIGLAANTPAQVPLGTLPVSPRIEFADTVNAAIKVTYRGITGEILSELDIADPSLAAGEMLLVDCCSERIFVWDGTSYTQDNTLYVGGSFPVLDPGDGNAELGVFPTLAANFGALVSYRRAYS